MLRVGHSRGHCRKTEKVVALSETSSWLKLSAIPSDGANKKCWDVLNNHSDPVLCPSRSPSIFPAIATITPLPIPHNSRTVPTVRLRAMPGSFSKAGYNSRQLRSVNELFAFRTRTPEHFTACSDAEPLLLAVQGNIAQYSR